MKKSLIPPFFGNPDGSQCYQSCIKMGMTYFQPSKDYSFEFLDNLTGKVKGKETWLMATYNNISDLGYDVIIYDHMDIKLVADSPELAAKKIYGEKNGNECILRSDIAQIKNDAKNLLLNNNVVIYNKNFTNKDILNLISEGYLALCWVDLAFLNEEKDRFIPHGILIYDADNLGIYAHDPGELSIDSHKPSRFISWTIFNYANKIDSKKIKTGEIMFFKKKNR